MHASLLRRGSLGSSFCVGLGGLLAGSLFVGVHGRECTETERRMYVFLTEQGNSGTSRHKHDNNGGKSELSSKYSSLG